MRFLAIFPDGIPDSVWDWPEDAERALVGNARRLCRSVTDPRFGGLCNRLERPDDYGLGWETAGWIVQVEDEPDRSVGKRGVC